MCIENPPEVTLCNERRHFFALEQDLNAVHHVFFNQLEFAGLNLTHQLLVDVGVAVETDHPQEVLVVSHC